jgi:hypothetical protein
MIDWQIFGTIPPPTWSSGSYSSTFEETTTTTTNTDDPEETVELTTTASFLYSFYEDYSGASTTTSTTGFSATSDSGFFPFNFSSALYETSSTQEETITITSTAEKIYFATAWTSSTAESGVEFYTTLGEEVSATGSTESEITVTATVATVVEDSIVSDVFDASTVLQATGNEIILVANHSQAAAVNFYGDFLQEAISTTRMTLSPPPKTLVALSPASLATVSLSEITTSIAYETVAFGSSSLEIGVGFSVPQSTITDSYPTQSAERVEVTYTIREEAQPLWVSSVEITRYTTIPTTVQGYYQSGTFSALDSTTYSFEDLQNGFPLGFRNSTFPIISNNEEATGNSTIDGSVFSEATDGFSVADPFFQSPPVISYYGFRGWMLNNSSGAWLDAETSAPFITAAKFYEHNPLGIFAARAPKTSTILPRTATGGGATASWSGENFSVTYLSTSLSGSSTISETSSTVGSAQVGGEMLPASTTFFARTDITKTNIRTFAQFAAGGVAPAGVTGAVFFPQQLYDIDGSITTRGGAVTYTGDMVSSFSFYKRPHLVPAGAPQFGAIFSVETQNQDYPLPDQLVNEF